MLKRRGFLRLMWSSLLAASGLIGIGALIKFLSYQPAAKKPEKFFLDEPPDIPPGSVLMIPEAQAAIRRGEQGLVGYRLTCPHLGCLVNSTQTGFSCPCHGSQFDINGLVIRGPARKNLDQLVIEETDEGLLIG